MNLFKTLYIFMVIPFLAYSQSSTTLIPLALGNTWTYHEMQNSNSQSLPLCKTIAQCKAIASNDRDTAMDLTRIITITDLSKSGDTVNFTVSVHDSEALTKTKKDTSYLCQMVPNQFFTNLTLSLIIPTAFCDTPISPCENYDARYAVPGRKTYNLAGFGNWLSTAHYIVIDSIGVATASDHGDFVIANTRYIGNDSVTLVSFNGKTLAQWTTTPAGYIPLVRGTHSVSAAAFKIIAFGNHCGVRLVQNNKCFDIRGRSAEMPKTIGRTSVLDW